MIGQIEFGQFLQRLSCLGAVGMARRIAALGIGALIVQPLEFQLLGHALKADRLIKADPRGLMLSQKTVPTPVAEFIAGTVNQTSAGESVLDTPDFVTEGLESPVGADRGLITAEQRLPDLAKLCRCGRGQRHRQHHGQQQQTRKPFQHRTEPLKGGNSGISIANSAPQVQTPIIAVMPTAISNGPPKCRPRMAQMFPSPPAR